MDAAEVSAGWSRLLDGAPVRPDDDFFFDLGGHSLLGAAIVTELAAGTGLPVELRDLYLAPTPRELAAHLDHLAGRLAELRADLPAGAGSFDLEAFVAALTELGAGAADTLLPAGATATFGAPAASRLATLREARGNGACERVPGAGPGVLLQCGARLLRLEVVPGSAGPHLRFTEAPAGQATGIEVPVGEVPVGEVPVGEVPVGEVPVGEVPGGAASGGQAPAGGGRAVPGGIPADRGGLAG